MAPSQISPVRHNGKHRSSRLRCCSCVSWKLRGWTMDPDLDLDLDMDMETLAGDSGGEAERNEAAEAEAEVERYEAAEAEADILRDRFRLAVISIATAEGKKAGMTVADPVVSCIADLAFKSAEQLAKDAELFAQHAGRKSVRMDDVILTVQLTGTSILWACCGPSLRS
ncbi:uncharacterized protein [Zea mays]|uniref:Centromere protein S n=1 Tax=Zea mays TaxID=4577 RepID=A0A804MH03_MAIZE|nr:uncharacterized protein LOC100277645 isoform X1 [Zea mays]|eukprot:XP_008667705.1 uncharacterized protein LOC100277645 isoform X1 [Zea mays]